jgi:hypothetical protein
MCGLPTGRAFWSAPFSRCYACDPIAVNIVTSDFCVDIRLTRAYKLKTRAPAIFPEALPAIDNALTVEYKVKNQPAKVTLEVQQDLGNSVARTIPLGGTEGLKRGLEVLDTGGPVKRRKANPSSTPAACRVCDVSPCSPPESRLSISRVAKRERSVGPA